MTTAASKALYADRDRSVIAEELAILAKNHPRNEALRKKRAEIDEQRFMRERTREAWQ